MKSKSAALPKIIEVSRDNLRIEEKFCNFWAPLAVVMFSSSELIALTIYAIYGISAAGEIAGSYAIILTQFGIPLEIVGALRITDGVVDNLFKGLDVVAHECELVLGSHKIGFIKEF